MLYDRREVTIVRKHIILETSYVYCLISFSTKLKQCVNDLNWLKLTVNHSFWNIGKYLFYMKSDIHQVGEFSTPIVSIIYLPNLKTFEKLIQ